MSTPADGIVLFGATGDLAYKKLFPALRSLEERGLLGMPVIGIAREGWTRERLCTRIRASLADAGVPPGDPAAMRLIASVRYVHGEYADPATFDRLAAAMSDVSRPVFYLAIPPAFFGGIVDALTAQGLTTGARVVVEKPVGRDLASAKDLNALLARDLHEDQIFRIDHFLGYEQVQNLIVTRFGNALLEPLWNRRYVSHVHIEMSESFGVDGRGAFYETVGCLRDVVQNHLLQLVCILAMEPPVSMDADCIADEKVKVLKSITPLTSDAIVRGQYEGYCDEAGVAPDSDVDTFCALRFEIDSWRWAGVPFTIRAGKRLARTVTEAAVEYGRPPRQLVTDADGQVEPNRMRFRLKPDDLIQISLQVKQPGDELVMETVDLSVHYAERLGPPGPAAYERLLGDAIIGEKRLFARGDLVEASWGVIEPLLVDPPPVFRYRCGSMGPVEADRLLPLNLDSMLSQSHVPMTT
ncbi:MAG: glucose-6-phosphate dehydrogenase [Thermoleophilia bacterium]|nr:glucose-6-phosphate dehydrogenase [Thermoleophilia bacterium]